MQIAYNGIAHSSCSDVMGIIRENLMKILRIQNVEVKPLCSPPNGAHVEHQVASFDTNTPMPKRGEKSLNQLLPESIRVVSISANNNRLHRVNYTSGGVYTGGRYTYNIHVGGESQIFCREYSWCIGSSLDVDAMKRKVFTPFDTTITTTSNHVLVDIRGGKELHSKIVDIIKSILEAGLMKAITPPTYGLTLKEVFY